jgi:hypothetical protein
MTSLDVSAFIKSKSDQLNADDLVGGDVTVQIREVRKTGSAEQPIAIVIDGGHMPVKPSKTMLRVLCAAWGTDASKWRGRWMRLYRDSSVKWGGAAVGGIRVRALSHIDAPMTLALAEAKGKKKAERVDVLRPDDCRTDGKATASLDGLLSDAGLTVADVDRWRATQGKGPLADLNDGERALFAAWLAGNPARLDAIRNASAAGGEE